LSSKLSFSQNIQPICLPYPSNDSELIQPGQYGYVTGWGQHLVNLEQSSAVLLQAQLPFIDAEYCRSVYGSTTKNQVCAGAFMKGTGPGDSGGPLEVRGSDQRWYQIGITSFGINDNRGLADQGAYPGRVIGGTTTIAHSWPWMVMLIFTTNYDIDSSYLCGATIISDQWLLTAAHCAKDMNITSTQAFIGIQSHSSIAGNNVNFVQMKIVHPLFNVPTDSLNNDIALLQLSSKLSFSQYIQPICLPSSSDDSELFRPGQCGYVTGWGKYTVNNVVQPYSSAELRQAQLPFIGPEYCRSVYGSTTNNQVCAGAFMKGTGPGDSGGPLEVRGSDQRWYQIGITSFGVNKDNGLINQGKYPGVYTRVSQYCTFIQEGTGGDVTCLSANFSAMLPTMSTIFYLALLLHFPYAAAEACGEPQIQPYSDNATSNEDGVGIQLDRLIGANYNQTVRVIGGTTATPHSWPWMVMLRIKSYKDPTRTYLCGATIISNQWLLTAAHCAESMILLRTQVYIGIQSRNGITTNNAYSVEKKIVHPQYSGNPEYLNDIALLKLSSKLSFSQYIQPICLPSSSDDSELFQPGQCAYVTGWGQYSVDTVIKKSPSTVLRQAQLPLIDPEYCRRIYGLKTHNQVCAGAFMKGGGPGDSGGPLEVRGSDQRWYQIGVTSFGVNEDNGLADQGKYPGVYTRVSQYCTFIQEGTGGDVKCLSANFSGVITC
uniref:Peptidase S1 domain-containing protein n=1 Tax=Plectus sambesii TaxID=2011161 RepID=A0A914VWR1_9BILA